MRVAVVVRSLKIGGMERAAINLAETFEANGHEAHLIYFRDKNKGLSPNERVYLHHFNLDGMMQWSIVGFFWNLFAKIVSMIIRESYFFWKGLFVTPLFQWKLKSVEKKFGRFDLIILRGHGTFEYIWPLHDTRVVQQQVSMSFKYGNMLRNFYLRCLYQNKSVICISSGVKEEVLKVFSVANIHPRRIEVITNPIDVDLIHEKSLEYTPQIDVPYIVNVGRFANIKNHPLLLEAYAYARAHLGLTHKLVLIGDGSIRDSIEAKIRSLHLEDALLLTGAIINPYPWVKNADLFVFTSFSEGLGNVLLEALACETNIVSTKGRGGIQDIMSGEMADHLCNFDTVELAEKIMAELNRTTPIDFNKALEPFTPKGIIEQYVKTYTC
jgi:glycosyltransferase involved in cell wall biosynthesis